VGDERTRERETKRVKGEGYEITSAGTGRGRGKEIGGCASSPWKDELQRGSNLLEKNSSESKKKTPSPLLLK